MNLHDSYHLSAIISISIFRSKENETQDGLRTLLPEPSLQTWLSVMKTPSLTLVSWEDIFILSSASVPNAGTRGGSWLCSQSSPGLQHIGSSIGVFPHTTPYLFSSPSLLLKKTRALSNTEPALLRTIHLHVYLPSSKSVPGHQQGCFYWGFWRKDLFWAFLFEYGHLRLVFWHRFPCLCMTVPEFLFL